MEGTKEQTELRKFKSQTLQKSERNKKKVEIQDKKEVRKRIKESLPTELPGPDKWQCSKCYTMTTWGSAPRLLQVCQDREQHAREWPLAGRREQVRAAFKASNKATCGSFGPRKLRPGHRQVDTRRYYDDFEDEDFSYDEEEDEGDASIGKAVAIVQDLSEFLVSKANDGKHKKQTVRVSFDGAKPGKPSPIYTDRGEGWVPRGRGKEVPGDLVTLLESQDSECSVFLLSSSLQGACPGAWSRSEGLTSPPRLLLQHHHLDITLLVGVLAVSEDVALCEVRVVNSVKETRIALEQDLLLTLTEVCAAVETQFLNSMGSSDEKERDRSIAPLTLLCGVEEGERREDWATWTDLGARNEPWHLVTMDHGDQLGTNSLAFCDICLDDSASTFCLSGCGHTFCEGCWRSYLVGAVDNLDTLDTSTPTCPGQGCHEMVDLVTVAWVLLAPSTADTWTTFLRRRRADLPVAACHRCHRFRRQGARCRCGEVPCQACGLRHHWPASCADYSLALTLATKDLASRKVVVEVRVCPGCGECWEKEHGCNHMRCGRCGANFCWGCGGAHRGSYCGAMTHPLIQKVLHTEGLMGLSSRRVDAFEIGIKKLKAGSAPRAGIQPRVVAREVLATCHPDTWFQHTRRRWNDLEQLPEFLSIERVVVEARATVEQGRRFVQFGYMLEQSEGLEARRVLEHLEAKVMELERQVEGVRAPRSLPTWTARVAGLTQTVHSRMATITQAGNHS